MHKGPTATRLVAAAGAALLLAAGAPVASAAGPLADVRFAVGDQALFGAPAVDGEVRRGTWQFGPGRMVDGSLELHFELEAARHALPVRSGPAVLFAGIRLYGSPGADIGMDMHLPPIFHAPIPACEDDGDCRYSVDISIPTDGIPPAITRFEQDGDLVDVVVDLALVRTFGAGQWLQVLGLGHGFNGRADATAGTLGAMEEAHGHLQGTGLFPADQASKVPAEAWDLPKPFAYADVVESRRARIGDASRPIPMVDVDLRVRYEPRCPYEEEIVLYDDGGNHLFYAATDDGQPETNATARMPIGSPWYLSMNAGDGIAYSTVRLGPIQSAGSPVRIAATIDCTGIGTGQLELIGAVTPAPPPPTRSPTKPPAAARTPAPTGVARTNTPSPSAAETSPGASAGTAASSSEGTARVASAAVATIALVLATGLIIRRRNRIEQPAPK
jgi:hypothetical protein